MINTKESQLHVMKPIKVFSLVLLALLLLVPAASAETYTLIDEDLVFGGSSGGVFEPEYFRVNSKVVEDESFAGTFYYYPAVSFTGVWLNGVHFTDYTVDNKFYYESLEPFYQLVLQPYAGLPKPDGYVASEDASDGFPIFYGYLSSYIEQLSLSCPESYVFASGPQTGAGYAVTIYVVPYVESGSQSATQHVTVTYNDGPQNYQVYVDTSDESVDVWVRGYVFGWLPVWTFGSNAFPPSTHFEWLTCPVRFLFWDVDWEVEVECNGESKFIYWNLDTPPIDGGTIPEPDPPLPDTPPIDPEPFDPDQPPPPLDPPSPNILPERIPNSIKEILNFTKEDILEGLASGIPYYSEHLYALAELFDFIFESIFALVALTLGYFIDALYQMLSYVYELLSWCVSAFLSFGQYFEIPNHILSRLVQILPYSLVNFALVIFGFDLMLNVLSIAISDLVIAYRSTVHTYYHKVDHSKSKGGKK